MTRWTDDPRVKRIFASFATTPPPRIMTPPVERWTNETTAYAGYRVECLKVLWHEFAAPILAHCDVTGDYEPWTEFCTGQPTVNEAIDSVRLKPDLDAICADVLADAQDQFRSLLAIVA